MSLMTGKTGCSRLMDWGVVGGMHANLLGVPLCKAPVFNVLTSLKGECVVITAKHLNSTPKTTQNNQKLIKII